MKFKLLVPEITKNQDVFDISVNDYNNLLHIADEWDGITDLAYKMSADGKFNDKKLADAFKCLMEKTWPYLVFFAKYLRYGNVGELKTRYFRLFFFMHEFASMSFGYDTPFEEELSGIVKSLLQYLCSAVSLGDIDYEKNIFTDIEGDSFDFSNIDSWDVFKKMKKSSKNHTTLFSQN